MENVFCDGVLILGSNVALSICVHLQGVRSLWVNGDYNHEYRRNILTDSNDVNSEALLRLVENITSS